MAKLTNRKKEVFTALRKLKENKALKEEGKLIFEYKDIARKFGVSRQALINFIKDHTEEFDKYLVDFQEEKFYVDLITDGIS